jgi:hypothetical protein
MDQQHRDLIVYKPERRIADDHGCTVEEVHAVLDRHPIEVDRDKYLKRALAMQLLQLDELEVAFRDKAIVDRDVASGVLLVKVAERRASLLGLNAPLGHAVQVIQHEPENKPSSTDRIRAAIDRIRAEHGEPPIERDDGPPTDQPH